MKIFLLFTLLFFWNSLENKAQEIPKEYRNSNTMVIQLDKNKEEILDLVARSLTQFDYEIEKIDKEYFTISTKTRLAKNVLNYYIKVKVLGRNAEFQIYSSMDISINGVSSEGYSISNFKGQKGSPNHEATMRLFSVVNSISSSIQFLEK